MPKFRLSDLELDEISLVLSGDNDGARVLIAKADREEISKPAVSSALSTPKEIAGSHGHRPHGTSIRWPALYEHLRRKGYSKSKAARISNAAWKKKRMGLPTNAPTSVRGVAKEEIDDLIEDLLDDEELAEVEELLKRRPPGQLSPHQYENTDPEKHGETKCDHCGMEPNSPMHKVARKRRSPMGKSVRDWWDRLMMVGPPPEDEPDDPDDVDKSQESGESIDTLSPSDLGRGNDDVPEITKDDLPVEVVDYIEALEAEVTTLQEQVSKALGGEPDKRDEVLKSALEKADPVVRAVLEQQAKDIEKANTVANAERENRLQREFIAKAHELRMISDSPDDLAKLLRKLYDVAPEEAAEVEKLLSTANTQIAKGNLFSEFGAGGAEMTISKSVESRASELMKSDDKLTREMAIARVYEMDPDLYEQALKEA